MTNAVDTQIASNLRRGLWQIMDVFSPTKGAGVYLRGDDDKGFYKTMSLRKFTPGQPEQVADQYRRTATKAEYLWKTSALEQLEGTSLTIEYLRRTRQPGQSYEPPTAVLAAHAGNRKAAMRAYSDWAHKVWSWRPYRISRTGKTRLTFPSSQEQARRNRPSSSSLTPTGYCLTSSGLKIEKD